MKKISALFFFFLIFFAIDLSAQNYGMGVFLDDQYFVNSPKAAPLMRGDYYDLPAAYSLKQFSPDPGSQGLHGTCTGWSTSYGGRTILEAIRQKWTKEEINKNAFSPSYVYNQIRTNDNCFGGASILDALDVLKLQGDVKINDFAYECDRNVTTDDKNKASEYRIIEYREIAYKTDPNKAGRVKKSLSEDKPVVIAMDCPNSFMNAKEVWLPDSSDYKIWSQGHGMTVVGYDDSKYGGAFEILNSWGTEWGKGGFTWMRYSDFEFFCLFAFELIDASPPVPTAPDLSGTLKFIESNTEPMPALRDSVYFTMQKAYVTGALFELRISNNEPAYVYAFGSDLTNATYKVFPFHDKMVAYLPYRQNNVAIPDEDSYNMLDAATGTTYYCFLYSKESIDIDNVLVEFEKVGKTFWENLYTVLGDKFVEPDNIEFAGGDEISFKAISGSKSIVPVVVQIYHD